MEQSETFADALKSDAEITQRIDDLRERIKAYPEEVELYDEIITTNDKGRELWEECESKLRAAEQQSPDDEEKSRLVREINQAHDKWSEYEMMSHGFVAWKVQNTSRLNKFGSAMANAGNAMQGAGKSMSSAGKAMTMWITIPIILAVLLLILFMFLL